MNKVTIILKDGQTRTIRNVTYILYTPSKFTVIEKHVISHEFKIKDVETLDVESN